MSPLFYQNNVIDKNVPSKFPCIDWVISSSFATKRKGLHGKPWCKPIVIRICTIAPPYVLTFVYFTWWYKKLIANTLHWDSTLLEAYPFSKCIYEPNAWPQNLVFYGVNWALCQLKQHLHLSSLEYDESHMCCYRLLEVVIEIEW